MEEAFVGERGTDRLEERFHAFRAGAEGSRHMLENHRTTSPTYVAQCVVENQFAAATLWESGERVYDRLRAEDPIQTESAILSAIKFDARTAVTRAFLRNLSDDFGLHDDPARRFTYGREYLRAMDQVEAVA